MAWVGSTLAVLGIVGIAIAQYRIGVANAWRELATVRGEEKLERDTEIVELGKRIDELQAKYDHVIELLESNIAQHIGDRVIKDIVSGLVNQQNRQE